jgi:hypothetical protein
MSDQNEVQDPNIIGELSPEARAMLSQLQMATEQHIRRLGQLEVEKARILGMINDLQGKAQEILGHEAERLKIPKDQQWQVMPDGKARLVPPQGVPNAAPPGA